jgi:hypothetical protein
MALADLLSDGSTIHAVDLDPKALQEIPEKHDERFAGIPTEIRIATSLLPNLVVLLLPFAEIKLPRSLFFTSRKQAKTDRRITARAQIRRSRVVSILCDRRLGAVAFGLSTSFHFNTLQVTRCHAPFAVVS